LRVATHSLRSHVIEQVPCSGTDPVPRCVLE